MKKMRRFYLKSRVGQALPDGNNVEIEFRRALGGGAVLRT